ncbi:MAG: Crp/Fnr family transcriptional regulator, partial [Chloroflexi bacterium]|nr:Crp/Fnr family transcriptional regulator [Chloroflexota bacterium]
MMEHHWHLCERDLFSGLAVEKQDFIAHAVKRYAPVNTFIFFQGDPADSTYYLESGEVRICRINSWGKESIMFARKAGEMFGLAEIAGEGANERECNAQAHTPCCLYEIKKEDFDLLMARHPALAKRVMGVLGRRLRYLCEQMENLMLCDVTTRLLKLLTYLNYQRLVDTGGYDEPISIPISLTQEQIAAMIGSCQQTVSEALKRLETQKMIQVSRKGITVLKPYDILARV